MKVEAILASLGGFSVLGLGRVVVLCVPEPSPYWKCTLQTSPRAGRSCSWVVFDYLGWGRNSRVQNKGGSRGLRARTGILAQILWGPEAQGSGHRVGSVVCAHAGNLVGCSLVLAALQTPYFSCEWRGSFQDTQLP